MTTPTVRPNQVAESFNAVPGDASEVVNNPSTAMIIYSDSSWTQIHPESGTETIVAQTAGLHRLTFSSHYYVDFQVIILEQ